MQQLFLKARLLNVQPNTRRILFCAGLVSVSVFCAAAVIVPRIYSNSAVRIERGNTATLEKPAPPHANPIAQSDQKQERPRAVRFRLFDLGILPREVHVDKRWLEITIEDYSGGRSGIVVERETGSTRTRAGQVDRGGPDWRSGGQMRLPPGRYQVYMADRPDNRALLVVEH
jgi:hypothetical protein